MAEVEVVETLIDLDVESDITSLEALVVSPCESRVAFVAVHRSNVDPLRKPRLHVRDLPSGRDLLLLGEAEEEEEAEEGEEEEEDGSHSAGAVASGTVGPTPKLS